jgi:PucR C-terminal helix-turn-helix domain
VSQFAGSPAFDTGSDRGAASAAPRTTPLTMVSAAVAGDDLESVARSAAEALGRPVAITLPARGTTVIWPNDAAGVAPDEAAVPIRIGSEIVGKVCALGGQPLTADERAWLEAAAAAAAVTALMRETLDGEEVRELIRALAAGSAPDATMLAAQARKLGLDLDAGAVGICAQRGPDDESELPTPPSALLAELSGGRVLGLCAPAVAEAVAGALRERGMEVAVSAPRADLVALADALREAELMVELTGRLAGQEETYRLLIGVLLRESGEVELLRQRTIAPLEAYDRDHDTELVATLQAFLAHHGSTTETAEALNLHRHTVGYRLTRVHEVSGLSPYESDGRERLSLGLKAHQILEADTRRRRRENM